MSAVLEKYGLSHLSSDEKRELIQELQDSMPVSDEEFYGSPEMMEMIHARLDRIDAELAQGIDRGVPWEVVRDEARASRKK